MERKFGVEVEFSIKNRDGKLIPAHNYFPIYKATFLDCDGEFEIGEIRSKPSTNINEVFVDVFKKINLMRNFLPADFEISFPVIEQDPFFPTEILTFGLHISIDSENPENESEMLANELFDEIFEKEPTPENLMRREKGYGGKFDVRFKDFGFEFRIPSAIWVSKLKELLEVILAKLENENSPSLPSPKFIKILPRNLIPIQPIEYHHPSYGMRKITKYIINRIWGYNDIPVFLFGLKRKRNDEAIAINLPISRSLKQHIRNMNIKIGKFPETELLKKKTEEGYLCLGFSKKLRIDYIDTVINITEKIIKECFSDNEKGQYVNNLIMEVNNANYYGN